MDPQVNNQVTNQGTNTPQGVPQKSNKKFVLWGFLGGLAVLAIVLVGAFYFLFPSRNASNVSAPKETTTVEESVQEVNGVSDLGSLLVELAEADDTLDKELTSLEKDSDF